MDDESKTRVQAILDGDALQGHSVLLCNETDDDEDDMVTWLATLCSVFRR